MVKCSRNWTGADDVMFFPYGAARMVSSLESALPYLVTGAPHVHDFLDPLIQH